MTARRPTSAAPATRAPASSVPSADHLLDRIVSILEGARERVVRAVNSEMVLAYWHIGREIVEHLQGGDPRAKYGQEILSVLSAGLSGRYGKGFSVTNLRYFRLFFQTYFDRDPKIHHTAGDEFGSRPDDVPGRGMAGFAATLSWSHYRTLTKIEHRAERQFYELEAESQGWSTRHLKRQIHTHLFARLLKSRDKAGVLDLATRGQTVESPVDSLQDPYVLDFLGLPDDRLLRESDLESAIIEKLQHFLLELGKGFAFVARQKRLTFDDEHFYVDLVFYNCMLKCYLLVDLKMGRLTHQDVGQMDGYVRLFDDQCTTEEDNPTVGLILCAEKNEAVARYSVLHESKQLFAAKYVTHLPTIDELQRELQRERRLIEARRKR